MAIAENWLMRTIMILPCSLPPQFHSICVHKKMFLAGFDLTGGLIGGVAIGAASSMLLWLTGRVTGESGLG